MARGRQRSGGSASMSSRLAQLESRIANIDDHIVLSLNIIKNALKGGNFSIRKLGQAEDDFEISSQILDLRPSEGDSLLLAQETCFSTPSDAVTQAATEMRDNGLPGPWATWTIMPSAIGS